MSDVTSSGHRSARRAHSGRRLCVTLLLAAVLSGLLCGAAASATAAPAPQRAIVQAFGAMRALAQHATSGSIRASATDAARRLALAAFPELWSNPREVVAPSYGTRMFMDSAAALTAIQRLQRASVPGLGPTVALVLAADRRVAQGMITEARGARRALLSAARQQLAAGDRAAAAGQSVTAVAHYTVAWKRSFKALEQLVATRVTNVQASAVRAAASNAIGSKRIGLAGPVIQKNLPPLTLNGKPELLYIGAEACPFCAVERWGMIVALSRFGTFSNLHLMQSATTERPEVRSFTFFGSSYRSPYVSFVPVEVFSNVPAAHGLTPLQRVTPAQFSLFRSFDPPMQFPFVDVANRYTSYYSAVPPNLVAGMTWTQIARSLSQPNSIAAQAVGGEAEMITAELCSVTNDRPQSVCSSAVIAQYLRGLPSMDGKGGGCPAAPIHPATRPRGQRPLAGAARCHT